MLYPIKKQNVVRGLHVFVAGLARAGTTILMRQLYATGVFRSLTYRDMPFVMAPNLWAAFTGRMRHQMAAQERAHGDGILVDFDSPEALDEVFWRIQCGARYIHPDHLAPMQATPEDRSAFQAYVAAILRSQPKKRYLSKNNNNILRLPDLAQSFPQAMILIPFRDPLDHAVSLQHQHQTFLTRHAEDPFSLRYMNWLAHHEFGANHKPFRFYGAGPAGDPTRDLGYWLQLWQKTYDYAARTAPRQAIFVCYETLCDETDQVWPHLCNRLDLPTQVPAHTFRRATQSAQADAPADLLKKCQTLYTELRARSTQSLTMDPGQMVVPSEH